MKTEDGNEATQAILESATRIASAEGLAGITVRGVASAAKVAPSAVIYYFETVGGLLSAIHRHVGSKLEAWREGMLHALDDPGSRLLSAEALSVAALSGLVAEQGLQVILQQDLHRAAMRGTVTLADPPIAAIKARERFWEKLLDGHGLAPEAVRVRTMVAEGLLPFLLLDRVHLRRVALIAAVLRRLELRLARRPVDAVRADPILAREAHTSEMPRGKRLLVEAAIRVIGQEGLGQITHRKVAAEAGLSLASTTYFYASKDALIDDAFFEMQHVAVNSVISADRPRNQFLSSILLDEAGEERWEMAAMTELNRAAIRSTRHDGLARTLRQVRGIDGMRWLRAHGHATADHLDGILWSAATTVLGEEALCLPPSERRAFLDQETVRIFEVLFGADSAA